MNLIGLMRTFIPNRYKDSIISFIINLTPKKKTCAFTNVYHCCVYKTGSQWFRRVFSDPRVYRWSGLKPVNGSRLPPGYRPPPDTAVTGYYISYPNFNELDKHHNFVSFFIIRDPRELVVSWYFSTRYTHTLTPGVVESRQIMQNMSDSEGILYSIDYWKKNKLFDTLLQWQEASLCSNQISTYSFEKLTGNNGFYHLKEIFSFCQILIPDNILENIYESHLPKNIASKTKKNKYYYTLNESKMRWPKYFSSKIKNSFLTSTPPKLVEKLGYKW